MPVLSLDLYRETVQLEIKLLISSMGPCFLKLAALFRPTCNILLLLLPVFFFFFLCFAVVVVVIVGGGGGVVLFVCFVVLLLLFFFFVFFCFFFVFILGGWGYVVFQLPVLMLLYCFSCSRVLVCFF